MSLPSPELPAPLSAAIEARLEGRAQGMLRDRARLLSERYRAHRPTSETIRDETDALAYAATRMPATYAAIVTALGRLDEQSPEFAPQRMLDVGCGLGAASCAAATVWPNIAEITLLDRSALFLNLAAALAQESGLRATIEAMDADMAALPAGEDASFDLVVVGYALTEIAEANLAAVVDQLWSRTSGALVIVEPGTPRDHARLMIVRNRLLALGANILAPCPHQAPCPLPANDWCHFSVRLPRRRAHKLVKGADAPFEDEKFAYLVAGRSAGTPPWARVIAPPRVSKAGISLRLCADKAFAETFIPKRDRARYEKIRKKDWGDPLHAPAEEI
ncbi:methyltransferase domain-containing protein [Methylocystis sp. L43]|jgi:ribosomal protein RSM22 (predicted rRNA methylase)|uniref:small ribosomal subunit Rsm22 family protein n=1 Tax=unclassified Methylocystis TaxID=2625913 RepID=UPI0018C2ABCC|nr:MULTISPECIES: small ribosomal subunit Rsm22 family protein [unclassified Methylocystis]MBG0797184.1 methyltransferase domain-containing protein [Methylocystis sp. L43]MBG0804945.1 methyltransferase domain-containing protein [Methylocystis sp. H15]